MHAEIAIGYQLSERVKKLDADQYRSLVEGAPWLDLPVPQPTTKEEWEASKWNYFNIRDQVVEIETTGRLFTSLDIPLEIKKFKNTYHVADHEHTHIHCHIPNVGLLMIDEVDYLEDACTVRLQDHLDKGWRILAVCPPNAQRRPDYILGRTKSGAT